MTIEKFEYLMTLFGYETEKWIRPLELKEIIVNNSGNHVYGYQCEKIMFSPKDQVIYLKQSVLGRQSAMLKKSIFHSKTVLTIPSGVVNPYKGEKRIRYPKTGDYIGLVTLNNVDIGVKVPIKSFKKLQDGTGTFFELYDDTLYNTIKNSDCKLLAYVILNDHDDLIIPNPKYPQLLFNEIDMTDRKADNVIPISRIVGFEFTYTPENTIGV